jgi:hypothetical protein
MGGEAVRVLHRKKIYYIFDQLGAEYKVAFKELHPAT